MARFPWSLIFWGPAIATLWVSHAGPAAAAAPPTSLADHERETHVYGGDFVQPCGWPTTVSMQGNCTGTLVHPQVVIYAAHCGGGFSSVQLGESINPGHARSVPTEFCRTFPGGGPGSGDDMAFCVLAEAQDDIPIVPILLGCETDVLTEGRPVVVVGYGSTETGGYGEKKEVTADFQYISAQNEAFVGGGGLDSCQGDSGGPVYVQMPSDDGGDGTWRVFGITSYGSQCGAGGFYSMMHVGIDWFETESGFDLTPCHDADGTWNPGIDCGMFPRDPATAGGDWSTGCAEGDLGGFSAICGAPFNADDDMDAPVVTITAPMNGVRLDSLPGESGVDVTIEVTADDGAGYGVDTVELLLNDASVTGGVLSSGPYNYPVTLPPGTYKFDAVGTDFSGNVGMSESVYVGVDMDPEIPSADTGESGSASNSGTEGPPDEDESEDEDDAESDTDGTPGQDGGNNGCGCRSGTPAPLAILPGLLLLGLRRRRC